MATTAVKTKTPATSPEDLREALVDAIRESVTDATAEWNKTDRYETFKLDGCAFALVFAAGSRTVSVKIPRQLRDVKLSTGAGFKRSEYGLHRSLSGRGDVKVVAKAIAAAAAAVKR